MSVRAWKQKIPSSALKIEGLGLSFFFGGGISGQWEYMGQKWERKKNHINYTRPPLEGTKRIWWPKWGDALSSDVRNVSFRVNRFHTSTAECRLFIPVFLFAATRPLLSSSRRCASSSSSSSFVSLHTIHVLKCHSVLTFTNTLSLSETALSGKKKYTLPFSLLWFSAATSASSSSLHSQLFSAVMNALIWRGRWFHPELLAAGWSMKASRLVPLGLC